MKNYQIFDPLNVVEGTLRGLIFETEADFIYAQPSGVSTLHRFRQGRANGKSDIVAVVPANLLILEV